MSKDKEKTKSLTIRMPSSTLEELQRVSQYLNLSQNSFVVDSLEVALKQIKDGIHPKYKKQNEKR